MSTYERVYSSAFHDPLFFWLAAFIFLIVFASRLPFLAAFLAVFLFEIVADALFTGALSPIPKGASWGTPVVVAFVILGDFRYFLLIERYRKQERSLPSVMASAAVWAFVVPVISFALRNLVPTLSAPMRITFLTYEGLFFVLALGLRTLVLPRLTKDTPNDIRKWLFELTVFEMVQYGLWITADILILSGTAPAFLMRLLPNAMYYALFLPFVMFRAPMPLRTWRPVC